MTRLHELQQSFAHALFKREPTTTAAVIATGSPRLSPLQQLEVYREQFWWRHVGCLKDDYPTLSALIGQDAFEELCVRYLAAWPPKDFLLRDLGKNLAEHLRAEGDRLLVDVASVEWAFVDAFDAADAPPLDPATIAEASADAWPGALLSLQPSLVLLDLQFPADELRMKHRAGESLSRVDASPRALAIYRRDLLLYSEPLEPSAHLVLAALMHGETLASACQRAADAEENLGGWFARWAALGWISRVDFSIVRLEVR